MGEDVTFMVLFAADSSTYLWQVDGVDITDGDMSTLMLTTVDKTDAGNYTCRVSTDGETITTTMAQLFVCELMNLLTILPSL